MKRIGSGIGSLAAGTVLLDRGVENVRAATEYADYHYETSYTYDDPAYEYCLGTDVRILEEESPYTDKWEYYITIGNHCSSKWTNPENHQSDHPYYFGGETIYVDYDTDGYWEFPDTDSHKGAYEYSGDSSPDILEDEIDLAVDFAASFVGTKWSVAVAVADYISGGAFSADGTTHTSKYDYANNTGYKWRSGAWLKFRALLDPGQTVSFDFTSTLHTQWGLDPDNSDTIYIMAPGD